MSDNITCYKCSFSWSEPTPVSRSAECPKCIEDARVCLNCEFYDSSSYNECKEPSSDRITEKEKRNTCDYFRPSLNNKGALNEKKHKIISAAEALFKKK